MITTEHEPETAPDDQSNALRWFRKHWSQIRYLYYLMFGLTAAPAIAEYFSRIGPPQMQLWLRVLYTSIIAFLAVMICYSASYKSKESALTVRVFVCGLSGLVLVIGYFAFVQRISRYNSDQWERVVIGVTLLDGVKGTVDASVIPLSSEQLLRLFDWDARSIWSEAEIDEREFYCLLAWSLAIVFISASMSFFALQQDQRLINSNKQAAKQIKKTGISVGTRPTPPT